MHVQIQISHYFPHLGGAQNIVARLAAELVLRQQDVQILCQASNGHPGRTQWEGIDVISHPYVVPTGQRWVFEPLLKSRQLRRTLPAYLGEADVIWTLDETYALATLAVTPHIPVVYIAMHNSRRMLFETRRASRWKGRLGLAIKGWQYHRFQGHAIKSADQVVVWCEMTRHDMQHTFGVPAGKMRVVPLGPGPLFDPPHESRSALRRHWQIEEPAPVILCVCRLDANKNVPHLIRAFARCRNGSAVLVVVGDGPQRPAIERLTVELGVSDRVRLVGAHRNPAQFYAIADIFAFPSIFEGFGMVLLEAMREGLPCVALKADYPKVITASEEVIENGVTGFIVSPYSAEELTARLDALCDAPELRQRMGHAGRQRCHERFNWDAHVGDLLSISRALCADT
jgi:glycosyltransferase involved in cell wall biosynthesis